MSPRLIKQITVRTTSPQATAAQSKSNSTATIQGWLKGHIKPTAQDARKAFEALCPKGGR